MPHSQFSRACYDVGMRTSLLALFLLCARPLSAAKAPAEINFKTGQVIGISTLREDGSSLLYEGLTGSRYSHSGVISVEDGEPVVYNAYPPAARVTPLPEFLDMASLDASGNPEFTLVEPSDPLSEDEERALVAKMREMVDEKAPFNRTMRLNGQSMNCAEFVHRVFHHIGREKVGEVGALARMNLEAFDGLLASKLGKLPSLLEFGVSPTSVIHSPDMKVVHAGLPVDRILSDAELYKQWNAGGGLEPFSKRYGVPLAELHRLGKRANRRPYRRYPTQWRRP